MNFDFQRQQYRPEGQPPLTWPDNNEAVATGQISALRAHRIVEVEGNKFSVRQLVSEGLTAMFPPAPVLDPIVVNRNFTSLCSEQGLYPAEIAKAARISATSAVNYAEGRSRRINREMLTKVAQALGLTLTELVDSRGPR